MMIKVGQTVRVAFATYDDTGSTKVRTVQGRCIFRHPPGAVCQRPGPRRLLRDPVPSAPPLL